MRKLGLLLLAAFFAFNFSVSAQKNHRTPQAQQQQRQGGMRAMMTPEKQAEQLKKELTLTDAQEKQLVELFTNQKEARDKQREEFMKNRSAQRQMSNEARETMRAEREKIQKEQDTAIEKIIGKEKMALLVQKREERREANRSEGGERRGNRN